MEDFFGKVPRLASVLPTFLQLFSRNAFGITRRRVRLSFGVNLRRPDVAPPQDLLVCQGHQLLNKERFVRLELGLSLLFLIACFRARARPSSAETPNFPSIF